MARVQARWNPGVDIGDGQMNGDRVPPSEVGVTTSLPHICGTAKTLSITVKPLMRSAAWDQPTRPGTPCP